jgi:hypothetical protein
MEKLVKEAHRLIEAALPEDEPDCVPDWVCELLIKLGQRNSPDTEMLNWLERNPRISEIHLTDGQIKDCYLYAVSGAPGLKLREIISSCMKGSL